MPALEMSQERGAPSRNFRRCLTGAVRHGFSTLRLEVTATAPEGSHEPNH